MPAQASADASGAGETIENFLWDGLALIHRGGTNYINEPAVTGGNPILADDKVLFNDMLGTTLGVKSGESFNQIAMTAFGDTENKEAMFTGKPYIGEIGYAFLFRNYRADQGKWQTADPLGYPDGWNNLTYVNNRITSVIDFWGLEGILIIVGEGGASGGLFNLAANTYNEACEGEATIINVSSGQAFVEAINSFVADNRKKT